ncbi:hypothetical protein NONO_c20910 [Nocardia nova SH22a]|uniref:Uncharacterized protein n=1 Tax=Nocardia nova SH22a TaxID=1415166 RepID=W5TCK1_9NOCA|nr:hypothetical protein NONO_c20910 [Nocardia nova SH22a]
MGAIVRGLAGIGTGHRWVTGESESDDESDDESQQVVHTTRRTLGWDTPAERVHVDDGPAIGRVIGVPISDDSRNAPSRPSPRLPPVTTATFPVRSDSGIRTDSQLCERGLPQSRQMTAREDVRRWFVVLEELLSERHLAHFGRPVNQRPYKTNRTATAVEPSTNSDPGSIRIDVGNNGYRQCRVGHGSGPKCRWAVENAEGLGRWDFLMNRERTCPRNKFDRSINYAPRVGNYYLVERLLA